MKTSFRLTIYSGKRTKLEVDCWPVGQDHKEVKFEAVTVTRGKLAEIITQALEEVLEGVNMREQEIVVHLRLGAAR